MRDTASSARSPARLFDALAGRGAEAARLGLAEGIKVVALPGERPGESLAEGDLVIHRALGEGDLARITVLDAQEAAALARAGRLPLDRLVVRRPGEGWVEASAPSSYVRWVQESLNRIMNAGLTVDGDAGSKTREAIKAFQRRQGLKADGVVGAKTEAALISAGAAPPPGAPGATPAPPPPVPGPATVGAACSGPPTMVDGFPKDGAALDERQRAVVAGLARTIADSQGSGSPVERVCLVGHTDDSGAADYNLALGARRAEAVEAELKSALERLSPGLPGRLAFERGSRGEDAPVAGNASAESRARNRRVEVLVARGRAEPMVVRAFPADVGEWPAEDVAAATETDPPEPVIVTLGPEGRLITGTTSRLPAGVPGFTWTVDDPSIARVSPLTDSQTHPNRVTVLGLRPGSTTLRMLYRPRTGAPGTVDLPLVVSRLTIAELRDPAGRVAPGDNELVRPAPTGTPLRRDPAARTVVAKLEPAAFWSGRAVEWSFTPVTPVRGILPAARATLEAVPGFTFTSATRRSIVTPEALAAVRVVMPPVAFNRGTLRVSAVQRPELATSIDLEVPGIVVLDPGHGGEFQLFRREGGQCRQDSSANNATGATAGAERVLTLDMAFKVRAALEAEQRLVKVLLTRDVDINLALADRARFARFHGADVMACIHFNAAERQDGTPDPRPHGPVVFIRQGTGTAANVNLAEDRALADRISAELLRLRPTDRARNVIEEEFAVLRDDHLGNTAARHPMRAVLIEVDFLTNPAADRFVAVEANRTSLANAIAAAIMDDLEAQG